MSIFVDRNKLSPRYVPERLPHREEEIKLVERFFSDLFPNVERNFTRIIQFQGPAGVGKSSVAFHVGKLLKKEAEEHAINLKHVYLNLKLESATKFVLYSSLASKIDPDLVVRSMSAEELLRYVLRYLKFGQKYVIITVDEVDYYLKCSKNTDLIFDLTRMNEIFFSEPINVLGIILIARDPKWREELDPAEKSTLGNIIVDFKPYTKEQVYDILEYRAREAFRKGAISAEVLEYVAEVTVDCANSDIRYALDILLYAGTLAESENSERVTLEHVRSVLSLVESSFTSEDLMTLNGEEKLALLAVAQSLRTRKEAYVGLEDVWDSYLGLCEQYKLKPVDRRDFNELLKSLYNKGLIDVKGFRIGISGAPVEKLSRFLEHIIGRLIDEICS